MLKKILSLSIIMIFILISIIIISTGCNDDKDEDISSLMFISQDSDDGGDGESNSITSLPPCTPIDTIKWPYDISFDHDKGYMYTVVNGVKHLTKIGVWGGHGRMHTGHPQGNCKIDAIAFLTSPNGFDPPDLSSLNNGDGTCEPHEICVMTKEEMLKNQPYYKVQEEGMSLIKINYTNEWKVAWFKCNFMFDTGHSDELSEEFKELLAKRFGSKIHEDPESFDFTKANDELSKDPLPLPKGMRLVQPRITGFNEYQKGNNIYYYGGTQQEFMLWNDVVKGKWECYAGFFSEETRNGLQKAIDTYFTSEIFKIKTGDKGSHGIKYDLASISQSKLCAVESFVNDNFNQISSNRGGGWINVNNGSSFSEKLVIIEINKDTQTYQMYKDRYTSPDTNYILYRAYETQADGKMYLKAKDSDTVYPLTEITAEIIDFQKVNDTKENTTLALKLKKFGSSPEEIEMNETPIADGTNRIYLGIRYRLTDDALLVHWGEVADSLENIEYPSVIPEEVTCNGEPYYCYEHINANNVAKRSNLTANILKFGKIKYPVVIIVSVILGILLLLIIRRRRRLN